MPRKRMTVITASDNPKPTQLSVKEKKVRAVEKRKFYATTTNMGLGMSRTGGDVLDSLSGQFYSPQLSTDFLEKPQNLRERRAFYRFFYNTNEFVGQAVDIHSTLPLSKLRLLPIKSKNKPQADYVFKFFENMCEEMKLFKTLIEISHEYNLFGNCFMFHEAHDWMAELQMSEDKDRKIEEAKQRSEFLAKKYGIVDKNPLYKGWKKILVLPPDQVRVRKIALSDEIAIDFVPDPETRRLLTSEAPLVQDQYGSSKYTVPSELKDKVRQFGMIPMDTDPNSGSFVFHLARKKSQYESLGVSILERCVNTLILEDKLRQAQTSIASRHMTPMRIVWADELSDNDVDVLREQVDMALVDPDFSIVANYEIHWEEMGSSGRLLDLSVEHEYSENRLFAGLGVTREILTGEGAYAGNRISLEIMNRQYLLFRETLQDYMENYLFKPIARKKGFIEYDEYGNEILLYPKVSFTRLAIRDNEQYFDAAFQLYQKGSISIDLILDILNIDPEATREKIEKDIFTVNDSLFNELLRNLYTNVATSLVDKTDLATKLAGYLKLNVVPEAAPAEGSARFSSEEKPKILPNSQETEIKIAKIAKYLKEHPDKLDAIFKK